MRILPQRITEFYYTSVSETYAEWTSIGQYFIQDDDQLSDNSVVRVGNYYYRTITGVSGGPYNEGVANHPLDTLGTKWILWAVSNPYAMIDLRATTATVAAPGEDLVVEFPVGIYDTLAVGYYEAKQIKIDNIDNTLGIMEGLVVDPGSVSGLSIVLSSGVVYFDKVEGVAASWRHPYLTQVLTGDFVDDRDNYIEVSRDGLVYKNVAIDDPAPALGPNNFAVVKLKCVGGEITEVTNLVTYADNVVTSYSEAQSVNDEVFDYFDYTYTEYTLSFDRARKFTLLTGGSRVRVSFSSSELVNTPECGFFVVGLSIELGEALYGVSFSFESFSVKSTDDFGLTTIIKRGVKDLVDFETVIASKNLAWTKRNIKNFYDEIVVFIVDDSDDSVHENLMTLGTIENVSTVLTNATLSTLAWSIQEII